MKKNVWKITKNNFLRNLDCMKWKSKYKDVYCKRCLKITKIQTNINKLNNLFPSIIISFIDFYYYTKDPTKIIFWFVISTKFNIFWDERFSNIPQKYLEREDEDDKVCDQNSSTLLLFQNFLHKNFWTVYNFLFADFRTKTSKSFRPLVLIN